MSAILHSERFAPAMVDVHRERLLQMDGNNVVPSRWYQLVDDRGHALYSSSERYRVVRNADLIAAADLAAESLGVEMEAGRCQYRNGHSRFQFVFPDSFRVPGDASAIRPQMEVDNDYRGGGGLMVTAGVYRLVCTNGLTIGKVEFQARRRHVGNFDLLDFMVKAIAAMQDRMVRHQEAATRAAETSIEVAEPLICTILEETAPRYRAKLHQSIYDNEEEVGSTVWALLQAVAEVQTHDMRNTWAAQDWQARQTERVMELVAVG